MSEPGNGCNTSQRDCSQEALPSYQGTTGLTDGWLIEGMSNDSGDDREWPQLAVHTFDNGCSLYPCNLLLHCVYTSTGDRCSHSDVCSCPNCLKKLDVYIKDQAQTTLSIDTILPLTHDTGDACVTDDSGEETQHSSLSDMNECTDHLETVVTEVKCTDLLSKRCASTETTGENKPFRCDNPGCNYTAKVSGVIQSHQRIHTGGKPFKCDYPNCGSSFTTNGSLVRHIRTHTGEKPYKCDYPDCKYSAAASGDLSRHKRIHAGVRPYKCGYFGCKFSAVAGSDLMRHKLIHTQEKMFRCHHPNCNFSTDYKVQLKRHRRIHTGGRVFQCDHPGCKFTATKRCNFVKHQRIHSSERSFQCDYPRCNFSAAVRYNLRVHRRTHMKEE